MEKPAAGKFRYFGLLAVFLGVFASSFAQNSSALSEPYVIQNLEGAVKGSECTFLLCVPNHTPREVTYIFEEPKGDAKRVSIRKAAQRSGKQTDTLIEAVFIFNSAGEYEMPPITVKTGQKKHVVQLGTVTVSENPRAMPPNVFWAPGEEPFLQGKTTQIELRASFVEHIENADFPLNESAILELEEEITSDFAPFGDAITGKGELCAVYNFTPLFAGEVSLPGGTVHLTGTNGEECEFAVTGQTVFVEEYKKPADSGYGTGGGANAGGIFASAFTQTEDFSQPEENLPQVFSAEEDLQQLAALRSAERWSLLTSYSRQKRLEKEAEMGIDFSPDEKSAIQLLLFCGIFALFLLCALLMLHWHKIIRGVLFLLVAFCLGAFCIYDGAKLLPQGAVFAGGNICTVPDEDSLSATSLKSGSRITVKKKRGDWALIKYDDQFSGWVKTSDLYLINRASSQTAAPTENATTVWGKYIKDKSSK